MVLRMCFESGRDCRGSRIKFGVAYSFSVFCRGYSRSGKEPTKSVFGYLLVINEGEFG